VDVAWIASGSTLIKTWVRKRTFASRCQVDLFLKNKQKNAQVIEILAIFFSCCSFFLPAHNGDGNNQLSVG
jgi:hypothetical protein